MFVFILLLISEDILIINLLQTRGLLLTGNVFASELFLVGLV